MTIVVCVVECADPLPGQQDGVLLPGGDHQVPLPALRP